MRLQRENGEVEHAEMCETVKQNSAAMAKVLRALAPDVATAFWSRALRMKGPAGRKECPFFEAHKGLSQKQPALPEVIAFFFVYGRSATVSFYGTIQVGKLS